MNNYQEQFLKLLSKAIWEKQYIFSEEDLDESIRMEALQQTVMPLICNGTSTLQVIASNLQLIWEQNELSKVLQGIPFVILKGTAAAIYYPEPIRRTLGDIDLIVRPEDFSKAFLTLKNAGYTTSDSVDGYDRHIQFFRNRVVIELHRSFATLHTIEQEIEFDKWIYEKIKTSAVGRIQNHTFPRLENTFNGLVLLIHINQHLEEGLGFRQILDWIMFCDKCLIDEAWAEFKEWSDKIGLTKLAKVVAKLGQKYLGLRTDTITWCKDVDDKAVEELLEYVFECGNFGHKDSKNNSIVMVMSHGRGVKGFFQNLQRQGKVNWIILEKNQWLTPFAWMYQLCRYIKLGLKRMSFLDFVNNYRASKKRNRMLDDLEATRKAFKKY